MLSESSFLYCVFPEVFFLSERGGMWYLVFIICLPFCNSRYAQLQPKPNAFVVTFTMNSVYIQVLLYKDNK